VLAYFETGLTNGITEGFNLKAKLGSAGLSDTDPSRTTACGS
jgi:hypothetical protein